MADPLPPWMSDKAKRKVQNRRSQRQERERAEEISGRPQAGSGSSRRAPQDVRGTDGDEEVLEQLKFTDKNGIRVDAAELSRLLADADRHGRSPQLVIEFSKYGLRLVARVERISGSARR